MLSAYFDSRGRRFRTLRDGPAGGLFEEFAQRLFRAGYARLTARLLRAAEHFVDWTHRIGLPVREFHRQALVQFRRHLGRCRCPYRHADWRNVLHGARLFLRSLQEARVIAVPARKVPVEDPGLLLAFCQWMCNQRGTCEATLSNYGRHIRALLKRLVLAARGESHSLDH